MVKKKTLKLTIIIDEDFVADAVTEEAKQRGLSPEQLALEIVRDWYDSLSGEEDLADHGAALAEYREKGGIEARELFRRLREAP